MNLDRHTDLEIALAIAGGFYDAGNGQARRDKLGKRYDTIQGFINTILLNDEIPDSDVYQRFINDGKALAKYYMQGDDE